MDISRAWAYPGGSNVNICKRCHFNGRKWRESKEPLDEGERGVKKLAQNSTFKKWRSWHLVSSLHGKQMGKSANCQISFSWAPKSMWMVTLAMKLKDTCSLEEKAMTNLDSMLKSRDIILLTKVCLVKAMVFLIVMYGCDSWTTKKAEHRRTDTFKLWCWRRLLTVPWTAKRSNKSILKEINSEYSLEGLVLKLKLQYFGHLMQRADLLEKTLILGKI